MEASDRTVGIVGGTGMLGSAIALALLDRGASGISSVWVSNRSAALPPRLARPTLRIAGSNQALVDRCDVVVLCVPPASAPDISIDARDRLVISVMAGIPIGRIEALTGARRVVRAMSSPAAEHGLAYSPWVANSNVTRADRTFVRAVFGACGATDEVGDEGLIEVFTAMTGPVPGFVAYFASTMVGYAMARGVPPEVADNAVRQLFLAAGRMMAEGATTPADHVQQMVDYQGTTAAGLIAMRASSIADDIAASLDAAVQKTRTIG